MTHYSAMYLIAVSVVYVRFNNYFELAALRVGDHFS